MTQRDGVRGPAFSGDADRLIKGDIWMSTLSVHEALIYTMVTMSAVDRDMGDDELARIGALVSDLPVFADFDANGLVDVAQRCGEELSTDDDGIVRVIARIRDSLPERMHETAYAVAVEIAAADLDVKQEELRLLELIRDTFELGRLETAAIERGARARYRIA